HSGELTIAIVDGEEVSMGPGDTLSLPIGMVRTWANTSNETAIAFVVRGGELPQAPVVA
ncbi:MAG: putative RmlC-like cupin family protein, partial [Porticoccaceae bacterium]